MPAAAAPPPPCVRSTLAHEKTREVEWGSPLATERGEEGSDPAEKEMPRLRDLRGELAQPGPSL